MSYIPRGLVCIALAATAEWGKTLALTGHDGRKRRVNSAKSWIRVSLANVSVIRSPGRQNVVMVSFDQDYRSSGLEQRSRKRQYWVDEKGGWKIAYEAAVKGASGLRLPESFPRLATNRSQ